MNPLDLIDRYYAAQPPLRSLLIQHSQQVADYALALCRAHPEWHADSDFIREAAMLHDIGIFFCNAPKIFCYGSEPYIRHGYLGGQLLREQGLPRHARVAERHTGSGLTVQQIITQNIPLPVQDWIPETIEEKVICYADKFFSKSKPKQMASPEDIRRQMQRFGDQALENWLRLEQEITRKETSQL